MRVASSGTDWVRQCGEGGDRGVGQGAEWLSGLVSVGGSGEVAERLSGDAPMWLSAVDHGGASFLGGLDFETHTL